MTKVSQSCSILRRKRCWILPKAIKKSYKSWRQDISVKSTNKNWHLRDLKSAIYYFSVDLVCLSQLRSYKTFADTLKKEEDVWSWWLKVVRINWTRMSMLCSSKLAFLSTQTASFVRPSISICTQKKLSLETDACQKNSSKLLMEKKTVIRKNQANSPGNIEIPRMT